MEKKGFKLSRKALIIIILCAVLVVVLGFVALFTGVASDANRFVYELKEDGTYEVVDIKDTYRGGWFAKSSITVPSQYKGKDVTSIAKLGLSKTKEVIISEGIKSIGDSAFYASAIEKITFPSTLTSIGRSAFTRCTGLTSIELPDGITTIQRSTFDGCANLKSIKFPANIKTLETNAFVGCTNLEIPVIPKTITSIGTGVFTGCAKMDKYVIDPANTAYSSDDQGIIYNKDKTEIVIVPASIKSVTVPQSVTSIGDNAFNGCSVLQKLVLPDTVTEIGENAFENCTALFDIALGNGLAKIGRRAFAGCVALYAITVPQTVETVGARAFENCTRLAELVNLSPANIDNLDNYTRLLTNASESSIKTENGFVYEVLGDTVNLLAYIGNETDVVLPAKLDGKAYNVAAYAFINYPTVQSVRIPVEVLKIYTPNFGGCSGLKTVYFEGTQDEWTDKTENKAVVPSGAEFILEQAS